MQELVKMMSAITVCLLAARALAEPTGAIRVNVAEEKAAISPSLYGVFIEDISHAVDGGLYGELVQNRSFEEGVLPPGMKLTTTPFGGQRMEVAQMPPGTPSDKLNLPWPWRENAYWFKERDLVGWSLRGGGAMKVTEANPMNAASSRSLELTIPASPNKEFPTPTELINSGYWGIAVERATDYRFRCYIRPGTFQGNVAVKLQSADGMKTYANQELSQLKPGNVWAEYSATLTADAPDPNARLVLSFMGAGSLQADFISLFGPTFKDRPNGLKKEMADYIVGLHPSFIRWPGGCYVEGWSWDSAPDFRRTLGKPEDRPGMYGYWKYRSTEGFGFHEYLQFCEDLKAEPVYAVFGGMTVHPDDNVPVNKLQPYIDNALAAIEYARGPATSKWGAERAKMGHPEPFKLNYIEIGNEHATPLYGEYYKRFRDQIKAKYPDVTVIMSMFWSGLNEPAIQRAGEANIDMIDEHAYSPVDWIRGDFNYFDRYSRTRPWKIFVGEYASQQGNGDWAGGMGDSLYLMMCERNSDLVKMACYAPLFRNVNDTSWPVNLIDFKSGRSYAHGSYYVQKVFAENRPDVNLATNYEVAPAPAASQPLMAGKIGLGAWDTQVEFKELRVYDDGGKLLRGDDFTDLSGFDAPLSGTWKVEQGVLRQTELGQTPAAILLGKLPRFTTGRITVKARRTGGSEGFNLLFNAGGIDRFLFCNYGGGGNQFSAIQDRGSPEGQAFQGGPATPGKIELNRWYDLTLVLKPDSAEMLLDGKAVSSCRMARLPSFFAQAGLDKTANAVVLKATNYFPRPLPIHVQLDGVSKIGPEAKQFTIHGDSLTIDNDFDSPHRIVPAETPLALSSPTFELTLQPYSVNVIRVPIQH